MKMLTNITVECDEIRLPGDTTRYGLRSASRSGNVIDLKLVDRSAGQVSAELHLPTANEAEKVLRDLRRAA